LQPEPSWQVVNEEVFAWGKEFGEAWAARPFVHLDDMMRPYVLTRLKNEEGAWEYTRYLAEANAVLRVTEPSWPKTLPQPDKAEYVSVGQANPAEIEDAKLDADRRIAQPITTRDQAIQALREKNYKPAIEYFQREVKDRANYHSGWQRLGYAQREYAAHLLEIGRDAEAISELRASIASYDRAINHFDNRYSAEAYYHRSKARWRLWKLTESPEELQGVLSDADIAAHKFYEDRFVGWREFLDEAVTAHAIASTSRGRFLQEGQPDGSEF
jgi:hypothetical protein